MVPSTVRRERPIAERPAEPPQASGPAMLWLDASTQGADIVLRAQLARACKRKMIQTVEEEKHPTVHVEGGLGADGIQGACEFIFYLGLSAATFTVTSLITGVISLFRHDERRQYDRPATLRDACTEPLAHLRLHVHFPRGDRIDLETDEGGIAHFRLLIPSAGRFTIEPEFPNAPIFAFDYDPSRAMATSVHPEPLRP
jgi:hypothetical protein